jgi:threonine/homoserine/homoserine lactone efflux protein
MHRIMDMITGANLAEFIYASVAIMLAPGPSVMFTIARAVAWGRGTAILTVLGNSMGMLILSLVIAVGLGPLLQRSELLLIFVQVLGGLYLIYLGIDALKHRRLHAADMVAINELKPAKPQVVKQGFMVGVLNPKALVFFSAIFPQFVDASVGSITIQMIWFGVIFAALAFLLDGMWAVVVGGSRDWFANSQSRLVALRTMGGVVMLLLGALVIVPLVRAQFS